MLFPAGWPGPSDTSEELKAAKVMGGHSEDDLKSDFCRACCQSLSLPTLSLMAARCPVCSPTRGPRGSEPWLQPTASKFPSPVNSLVSEPGGGSFSG